MTPGYRSPATVLKKLANSRLELVLQKNAVRFDATDLSRLYKAILDKRSAKNSHTATTDPVKKLAGILQIKNYQEKNMLFVLENWALILLSKENELRRNGALKRGLKKMFELKANGSEEEYIRLMQGSDELRLLIEMLLAAYGVT